ncbi:NAD-dependent protein deacetylase sirtuin-3, mitochondrial [Acipenser ruthenus]|uniref:NAD-dependent protein deacetylase sirtuin-3, mitochondrial n=1 Tax=Acipenser ruthenus TaxID=7906 RepID=A0A662Z0L8_ACIRT|nr:NAD-dependent protein deacetylase sirtuin-3, mitochondrial [Acipenser ruthenus]
MSKDLRLELTAASWYCDCFANGDICSNCNCINCCNNVEHETDRFKAIKTCLDRNPEAFRPKIGNGKLGEIKGRHNKGCNCKRSGCLKNYCECYECIGCKNYEGSPERKTVMTMGCYDDDTSSSLLKHNTPKARCEQNRCPLACITFDVIEATCACLLAQAEVAEKEGYSVYQAEQMILEEFGQCLTQIVQSTLKSVCNAPLYSEVAYVTPKGPGFLQQGKEEYVGLGLKLWHRRCFSTSHSVGGKDGDKKQQTLEDVARLIKHNEYRRIVVMAGAGISTPSGIPDFRSPGSGLYDNLQQYDIPYPEAIFEINYFHHNPKPFFALAKELYPGNYKPNYTHYFIRLLHDKGLLHRIYTQNIDGLERYPFPPRIQRITPVVFQRNFKTRADILESKVPKCPTCKGVIKPDVVFFGEELPQCFFLYLTDFPVADLLVVMGTSLEVEPFASLAGAVRNSVPRVLINRDLVGPFVYRAPRHNDVLELGDVVSGVERFADKLGWKEELNKLIAVETGKSASESEPEDDLCSESLCTADSKLASFPSGPTAMG